MRIFYGIDPGKSGGIALVGRDLRLLWAWRRQHLTDREMEARLRNRPPEGRPFAAIEKVHAMPKQGVTSSFNFGVELGLWRMALAAARIPYVWVAPGTWQRSMGCLSKGDKNVTKRRAQELFPQVRVTHAIADALLIAAWCAKTQGGGDASL